MTDIAIIDYGMGNLHSVLKAVEHVAPAAHVAVTSDPAVIRAADRVIFPGQGAMPNCIREMEIRGLRQAVLDAADSKPFLGICIGLQMLFDFSEEGNMKGLGVLPGGVVRFPADAMTDADGQKLKVPHMGWNQVYQALEHPIWQGIAKDERFYFVHSYHVMAGDIATIAAYSAYPYRFTSAVARNNIFAVQFHPEKSQMAGLTLLKNFVQWKPH